MRLLRLEKVSAGDDAEARQARNSLRLAVACWVVGSAVFFLFQRTPVLLLAGFLLLGAVFATGRAFYHFAALATLRAPRRFRVVVQVVFTLTAALVPLAYLLARSERPRMIVAAPSLWSVAFTGFVGWCAYRMAGVRPKPPVRAYLAAVAVVGVLAVVASSGSNDERSQGISGVEVASLPAPELRLLNYIRYIAAAYVGISIATLRSRRLSSPSGSPHSTRETL